jgi:hypothetical protein
MTIDLVLLRKCFFPLWVQDERKSKQKNNTICVGHHYAQTKTDNVNKTRTTGGKDEPNIVFIRTSQRTSQHGALEGLTVSTSFKSKRDDFNVAIINVSHLDSNIPIVLAYGVNIVQLIRWARIQTLQRDRILQTRTTGGKDEPNIVFIRTSQRTSQHGALEGLTVSTSYKTSIRRVTHIYSPVR